MDHALHAVEALQDGALVLAHRVEAGNLDLHVAEPFGQPGQAVLQLAQAVAGHVAGGVDLRLHVVEPGADLRDRAGDGVAVAADVADLLQHLEEVAAKLGDLLAVAVLLERFDALARAAS